MNNKYFYLLENIYHNCYDNCVYLLIGDECEGRKYRGNQKTEEHLNLQYYL